MKKNDKDINADLIEVDENEIEKIEVDDEVVVETVSGKPVQTKTSNTEKTIEQLADEVMRGMHGSGRERMISLGSKYTLVQQEVNKRIRNMK